MELLIVKLGVYDRIDLRCQICHLTKSPKLQDIFELTLTELRRAAIPIRYKAGSTSVLGNGK